MFVKESPRWLIKCGRNEEAAELLGWFRNMPEDHRYLREELQGFHDQLMLEMEATKNRGFWGALKELFCDKSNLYRVTLGVMVSARPMPSADGSGCGNPSLACC